MTTVMHGRRKGESRTSTKPKMPDLTGLNISGQSQMGSHVRGVPNMAAGPDLPNMADLRQVKVLSKNDWERINLQLNRSEIEAERKRRIKHERESLKLKSKDMVKDWTNTIAGQRQKRLEARTIREAKEEEERKEIDIEEAQFQAQKRREAIDKAKTQQYYQTDRVKSFHSALMLTEVLKEREAQIELNRLKAQALDGQNQIYIDKGRRDYEDAIREDQSAATRRFCEKRDVAQFQKAQIREHIKTHLEDQIDDRTEGDELKRLAIQYQRDKKALEDIKRQEQTQNMSQNLRQIEDITNIREIQKDQEEEEDDECRIFAAAKRKMMKLRSEKEKKLHADKLSRLDKIRERLHAQMKSKMVDEDVRIRKAVEVGEIKFQREEEEKNKKVKKALAGIAEHRYEQMEDARQKATSERIRELEMLKTRQEADYVFQQNEQEKAARRFNENKDLSLFHLGQTDEITKKEVNTRQEQLAQDEKNLALVEVEENQFQEYATKVIDHCKSGGRNTYPLEKAAKAGAGGGLGPQFMGKGGIRPSYMVADNSGVQLPLYQKNSTEEIKRNIYGKNETHKRLGFVF